MATPAFDEWFPIPTWLPRDPDSATVAVAARLRHRMPGILIMDDFRRIRLFTNHTIVRIQFDGANPTLARFVWRQRYWGSGTPAYWFLGLGMFLGWKRFFRRGVARQDGDELRAKAFAAMAEGPTRKTVVRRRSVSRVPG